MITFRGAVVNAAPTFAGPRGRARWRNESSVAMILIRLFLYLLGSRRLFLFVWAEMKFNAKISALITITDNGQHRKSPSNLK
jgi:hypothetical protein